MRVAADQPPVVDTLLRPLDVLVVDVVVPSSEEIWAD